MKLEIETVEIKTKRKIKQSNGKITSRDMAIAFGQMGFGQSVFVPSERQQSLALAAYFVAVSRGGRSVTTPGEKDGVTGTYYSLIEDK